jgi:homocitrate synthase NifV
MKKIHLIDSTLCDSIHTSGIVFSLREKLHIAEMLAKAGIREVEVGSASVAKQKITDIKTIVDGNFGFQCLVRCHPTKVDIDAATKTGARGVHISFTMPEDNPLETVKDRKWAMESLRKMTTYAKSKFEYVTIGVQDASRIEFLVLNDFISEAIWLGASRIRIEDTIGILNPVSTANLMRKIRKYHPNLAIEFRAHNDLGMATANTFAAFAAGAVAASVTVNGLGERAGNAALEEVVMALELSSSFRHHLKTKVLGELSQIVSRASGIPIPVNKPVTGSKVRGHEWVATSGTVLKNPRTNQTIKASQIGF